MKRWTLRIVLLLVLGCVTTVAVAWGLVATDESGSMQIEACSPTPLYGINSESFVETRWTFSGVGSARFVWGDVRWKRFFPFYDFDLVESDDYRSAPASRWCFRDSPPNGTVHVSVARGWPLLALAGGMDRAGFEGSGAIERVYAGVLLPGPDSRVGFFAEPWMRRILPLRPIWPGFVIDTLFYGVIWFGIFFGFGSARRSLRKHRGRCPKCAYDLRGQMAEVRDQRSEVTLRCLECGWGRPD